MANSLQYLQQLLTVITELQNRLGNLETKLGRVQADSVKFNTQAGRWQGTVAGESMEGKGRGAGAPFLSREQVNPINAAAEEKYKSTLMEARQLFKLLSKEMGITRENYKLLMSEFPKFDPNDLGVKNWTKELETLYIKIESTIAAFERLSQIGRNVKPPNVNQGQQPPPETEPAGEPIPPTPQLPKFETQLEIQEKVNAAALDYFSTLRNSAKEYELLAKFARDEDKYTQQIVEKRQKLLASIRPYLKNERENAAQSKTLDARVASQAQEEKAYQQAKLEAEEKVAQFRADARTRIEATNVAEAETNIALKQQITHLQTIANQRKNIVGLAKSANLQAKTGNYPLTGGGIPFVGNGGGGPPPPNDPNDLINKLRNWSDVDPLEQQSADTIFNARMQAIIREREEYAKNFPIQKRLREAEAARSQGLVVETTNIQKKTRATQELSKLQVQSLRTDPTYKKAFSTLDTEATKLGFNPENMKVFANREVTTGITRISANLGSLDGVAQKVNLTVDRFGRTLVDTQRRFRTFGDAIRRDIVEVLKWSVAVGVVYGSIQKLQELVQLAITNESKLADVTIALGKSQQDTNVIFESAAKIANETGESISGVLEGYTLAYRATGNIANEYERIATANKLMADSLTLSSLSGMSQAEALDSLSASLRQTGLGLTQGTELLDKWVRTTQVANVDLQTLATGFAIVGEAADNAGIDVDQLNGILAAIAETGVSSATETANVTRAIISGYQSDNARKAIEGIGIALEDASGKARGFEDVVKQLNELRRSGALSDETFNKITLAWGGGARRQAPVAAFIQNYQRVGEVAKESFSASGEASAALAIKLDTVQKSLIRLGNAFQSLAQGLGEENGLLTVLNTIINLFTTLVELTGKLTGSMGSSLLPLLGTLGTMFLLRGRTDIGQKLSLGASSMLTKGLSTIPGMGQPRPRTWEDGLSQWNTQQTGGTRAQVVGEALGPRLGAGALGVLVSGVLPAIAEGGKNAGVKIGSSVVGAVIGGLTGPGGALIGASIGSSIGEMYLNYLESKKATIETLFTLKPAKVPEVGETPTEDQYNVMAEELGKWAQEYLYSRPVKELSQPLKGLGAEGITREQVNKIAGTLPKENEEFYGSLYKKYLPGLEGAGISMKDENQVAIGQLLAYLEYFGELLDVNEKKVIESRIEDFKTLYTETKLTPEQKAENALKEVSSEYQKANGILLDSISKSAIADIKSKIQGGDITVAAGQRAIESLETFAELAGNWAGTLKDQFNDMTEKQVLEMIANVAAYTPLENKSDITVYTGMAQTALTKISELQKQLVENSWSTETEGVRRGIELAIAEQQGIYEYNAGVASTLLKSAYTENLTNVPAMPRVEAKTLTKEQFPDFFDKMIEVYKQELEMEANARPNDELTMERVDALMSDTQTTMFKLSDGVVIKDMPASMTSLWGELYDETVKQTGIMEQGMGYQLGGMTQEQYNSILPQYDAIRSQILALGGTSEEEAQVVMFDDGQFDVQRKDWKIIQYLLGQIVDNTKKQLEGIYNMPEGASFWFPSSVIPYMQNAYSGGGGATTPETVATGIDRSELLRQLVYGEINKTVINPTSPLLEGSSFIKNIFDNPYGPFTREDTLGQIQKRQESLPIGGSGENIIPPTEESSQPVYDFTPLVTSLIQQYRPDLIEQNEQPELKPDFFDRILMIINNLANTTVGSNTNGNKSLMPFSTRDRSSFVDGIQDIVNNKNATKLPTLNTKIELTSTIQLIADGRTLASVVAPWLGEFISNFNGTESTVTIKAVI